MGKEQVSNLHEDHMTLLALAKAAFRAEDSAMWKLDTESAFEAHGDACDALWNELRRQCGAYSDLPPVDLPLSPQKQMVRIRKEAFQMLKSRLPDLIEEALGGAA